MDEEAKNLNRLFLEESKRIDQESKYLTARIEVSEQVYEAGKVSNSEEVNRLKEEVDDLKNDLKLCDKQTDELKAELQDLERRYDEVSALIKEKPDSKKRTTKENAFFDQNVPKELLEEMERLQQKKLQRYNHKTSVYNTIKDRERRIAELASKHGSSSQVFKETCPITGKPRFIMKQLGSNRLGQKGVENLEDMGRKFWEFVTNAKNQRTFVMRDLIVLLQKYKKAMPRDYTERIIIEEVVDKLYSNPDLARKVALMSLAPIMSAELRHEFDQTIQGNLAAPYHKKMLMNPINGNEDWRSNPNSKRGKGRGGSNQGGQPSAKKPKKEDEDDKQKPESNRGGGRGRGRGGGRGRGRGGKSGAKFQDQGGVE